MDDDRTAGRLRAQVIAARQRRPLPLAVWAGVILSLAVVAVLAATAATLQAATGSISVPALAAGLIVGACAVVLVGYLAYRFGTDVKRLTVDAVRPDGGDAAARLSAAADRMTELSQLTRLLDALQLRARVAEEMADQSQRTAHTASAGMFELLSGLSAAEEATRGQLSADLHDTVAQTLATARTILANPEGQQGAWERVRELVEDAEEELRAAMARTRPPELRDGDLASAVMALRREMSARYLLQVDLRWPDEPHPLPLVSAVTVYRFFQEALLNVVKHADVDEAVAALAIAHDTLVATVRDEGPGFEPAEVESTGGRHVGLELLRERARLAGGTVDIAATSSGGTELTLRLPIGPRLPGAPAVSSPATRGQPAE